MNEEKHYWQFSFDLNQKKLGQYYGKKTITKAYEDVGNYLMAHGFDNKTQKQGSCYFTSEKYDAIQANNIIRKMYRDLPWLPYCINPDKEALTIKSELEYSHTNELKRLTKSKSHIKKLNKYYDSVGASDKKIDWQKPNVSQNASKNTQTASKSSLLGRLNEKKEQVKERNEADKSAVRQKNDRNMPR